MSEAKSEASNVLERPLPCPFCGSDDVSHVIDHAENEYEFVLCNGCGAGASRADTGPERCPLEVWNMRSNFTLERGFDDHWALVRLGNPALADDVFAESLARTAWEYATMAEREACAVRCESLPRTDAYVCGCRAAYEHAANAIRARSNAGSNGPSRDSGEGPR